MKNFVLLVAVFLSCSIAGAQNLKEPDFIGEAFILKSDSTSLPLEKETVKIKTKAGASVYIVGIGKVKSKIEVDGCCSNTRTATNKSLDIVVRSVDNQTDPLSIISLFRFDNNRKVRKAELSSTGTFSGGSNNNLDYIMFQGRKFGESSYIITVPEIEDGEYGIIVRNPNSLDEKSTIVSTFGIGN
ncbi:hypothetical protein [Christiangramia sediminis]|uniref:Uncharacterized protein n=1 Tax=Christiangramia sediminis TaxID=2881336 RepID=A0A9X1LJR7_9FLAO|nr:hypothetical protein [Christiangramia sediminis]MCB7481651.1 hypothetical protein [Christiangramia sediminis]